MKKILWLMIVIISLVPFNTAFAVPPATNLFLFYQRKVVDTLPAGLKIDSITISQGVRSQCLGCGGQVLIVGNSYPIKLGGVNKGSIVISVNNVGTFHPTNTTTSQYTVSWVKIPFGTKAVMKIKTKAIDKTWMNLFKFSAVDQTNQTKCNMDAIGGVEEGSVCRNWSDRNYLILKNIVKIYWTLGRTKVDFDESKIYSPNPGTIYGDIYSGKVGELKLGDYLIEENSILASGGDISGNKLGTLGQRFSNYVSQGLDWNKVKATLDKTRQQLINERVKYWCGTFKANPKSSCAGVTTISGTWNLQNGRDGIKAVDPSTLPFSGYNNNPEGDVWYVRGDLTIGDKTMPLGNGNVTYKGRGTVIVDGNLNFDRDLVPDTTDPNAMIGFLVTKNVNFNCSPSGATGALAETVQAEVLSRGNITVASRVVGGENYPLDFIGLLAAVGNISLVQGNGAIEKNSAGSSFSYDGRIIKNPLPGFKALMGTLITSRGETGN